MNTELSLEQPRKQPVILLVDDETNVLVALRRLFHGEGYQIHLAGSGAEGLAILRQHPVDLVISDMMMPQMSGSEFLGQVYRHWSETVRILLTGYADLNSTVEAINKGKIYCYCNKPWNNDELKILVRNALAQKRLREDRDQLTELIRLRNDELRELNVQLEDKIQKRTAQLQDTLKQLNEANAFLQQQKQSLEYQARHDDLTGLANRNRLHEHMDLIIAQAKRHHKDFYVFFLDLDNFKFINDSLGHSAGDELLKTIGQRLLHCARAEDMIARYGGDEFVLVFTDIDKPESVIAVAERIIAEISRPLQIKNYDFTGSISIGISIYPQDAQDKETLLKYADIAMYQAKERGRNTFCFYTAQLNRRLLERLSLEHDLRHALQNEQFIVYYQPKVDLHTGLVCGLEALVRWLHPEKGLIPPVQFIELAEETGLILPLGLQVLRQACIQTKIWHDAGLKLNIAVNVSAKQLHSPNFGATISHILDETGLDPKYLDLEVTESAVMKDPEEVIITLNELKALGVKFSMDDFGTGYSSLSYLKRFPFDYLKIDKAFIADIPEQKSDVALVLTIIALAHNFNLTVIAEGVEKQAQADFLAERGCDQIQGYWFSPPLPAREIEKLLGVGEKACLPGLQKREGRMPN